MRLSTLAFLSSLVASPALAQQAPDQCRPTQLPGGGPAAADMIRQLRCTIAFIDGERMTAEDNVTRYEVEAAMAKLDRDKALAEADAAKKDRDKALAEVKAAKDKATADAASMQRELAAHARKAIEKK